MENFENICHLAGGQPDDEVGDERVFSLATAVRHHHAPARLLRHLARLDRLGDRSDLVDLEQQRVAGLFLDRIFHALRVRHEKIVAATTTSSTFVHTYTNPYNQHSTNPTSCVSMSLFILAHDVQSSWSKASSIDTTG